MRSHTLDEFDLILYMSFLSDFRLAFNINEIHGGAAIRQFHLFMKGSSIAALYVRLCLKPALLLNMSDANKAMLRTFPEVENYHFQLYTMDDVIAETGAIFTQFTECPVMSRTQCPGAVIKYIVWMRRGSR